MWPDRPAKLMGDGHGLVDRGSGSDVRGCGPALKMPTVEALKMPMLGIDNAPPVGAAERCGG
jgi:hypothetical protein